ncbi:MAG: LDCC motif putative metal-binding protein [Spirochaetaceae bacterium]
MNIFKRIKKRWMRYLKRMEKVNEKQFGHKRLECCDLNKE